MPFFVLPNTGRAFVNLTAVKHDTAPGPDPLSVEFYIAFFNVLRERLCDVASAFFQHGSTASRFRGGRIILLPKSNRDPTDHATWGPITLLNVVSRLLASFLAHRIRNFLLSLIHPLQCCFVPGRLISSVVSLTTDAAVHRRSPRARGFLVSLDQC